MSTCADVSMMVFWQVFGMEKRRRNMIYFDAVVLVL